MTGRTPRYVESEVSTELTLTLFDGPTELINSMIFIEFISMARGLLQ